MIPWANTTASLNTSHPAFGTGKVSSFAGFGPEAGNVPVANGNPAPRGTFAGRSPSGPFVKPKQEWVQSGTVTQTGWDRDGNVTSTFTQTISGGMSIVWDGNTWVIDDWREGGTFQRPGFADPGEWQEGQFSWSRRNYIVSAEEWSIQRNGVSPYQHYKNQDGSMGPRQAGNSGYHQIEAVGEDAPQYHTLSGLRTWKGALPLAWMGVRNPSETFSAIMQNSQDLGIRPYFPFNIYNEHMKPKSIRVLLTRRRNAVRLHSRRAEEENPNTLNAQFSLIEPTQTSDTSSSYQDVFSSPTAYYDFKGDVVNGDWSGIPFQISTGQVVQFSAPGLPSGQVNSRRCHVVRWRIRTLLSGEYRVRVQFSATGTNPPQPIEETITVSGGMSEVDITVISPDQRHNRWLIQSAEDIEGQSVDRNLFRFMFALRTGFPPQVLTVDSSTLATTRIQTRSASYVSGTGDILPALQRNQTLITTIKRTITPRLNAFRTISLTTDVYSQSTSNSFSFQGNNIHGGSISFSSPYDLGLTWSFANQSFAGGYTLDSPDSSGEILETREIMYTDSDIEWDGNRWVVKDSEQTVVEMPTDDSSWIRERVDVYAEKV